MQIHLIHNGIVLETTSINMDFAVSFKGVDVVEHKEGVHGENTQTMAILSIDNVESSGLIWVPIKPLLRARRENLASENSPEVVNERTFGDHNVVISERETVEICRSIGWRDFANHLTSTKRGLS